jgi:altronate dehydratase large subunit
MGGHKVIRAHPFDNVAVALKDLHRGEDVELPWGGTLKVMEDVPMCHKVALRDIAKGGTAFRYGQPIGEALQPIGEGQWVHSHNLGPPAPGTERPPEEGLRGEIQLRGPETFLGYPRPKGHAGVRNHLLVLPTVVCANGVARAIGRQVPEAVVIEHGCGCARSGEDNRRTMGVLGGCGAHPNVGAVVVVGLGCEFLPSEELVEQIASSGKPVEFIKIQDCGGSRKTTERGVELALSLLKDISSQKRVPCPVDDLVVGLECGGSDAFSGITANPVVGAFSDWLVSMGGTVILGETTEMIGTEHLLKARAANPSVAEALESYISKSKRLAREILGEAAYLVVAPGNQEGGLSTIMEKSLGCIQKGGTTTINEVVPYAQRPTKRGLIIMDTPGYDVESVAGFLGAGAQLILFTTGRGNPVGTPIAPVIKIASNSALWKRMMDDLDLNAGEVAEGRRTLQEMAQDLVNLVAQVADGRLTKAEENLQASFAISMTREAF